MNRRALILTLAAAANFLLAASLTAQGVPYQLPEITITASRTDEGAAGVTRFVLQGDSLRDAGVENLAAALRTLPGFHVVSTQDEGGVSSLFVRGGESDYVRVMVDGVTINDPGGAIDLAGLSMANVAAIEIVQGPASVIHGSDAMTGVVNIISRHGGVAGGALAVEGGSRGRTRFDASLRGGEAISWSLAADGLWSDGLYDVNSRVRSLNVAGRADFHPGAADRITATFRARQHRYAFPTDGAGVVSDSNQYTQLRSAAAGMDMEHRLGARTTATLRATGHFSTLKFEDRPDSEGDTVGFAYSSSRRADAARGGVDAFLRARLGNGLLATAGLAVEAEHLRTEGEARSNFGDGSTFAEDAPLSSSRYSLAGYAEATATPIAHVSVGLGSRLDVSTAFGALPTLRISTALDLAAATRLRVAGGLSFKAPTLSENFADSPFEVGDPDLRPESVIGGEIGITQGLSAIRGSVALTGYLQRFRDLIQYQFVAEGAPTYTNIGAASARGADLQLSSSPVGWIQAGFSVSLLRARTTGDSTAQASGAPLLRRPSRTARLWTEAAIRPGMVAGVQLGITGAREDLDFSTFPSRRVALPGYELLDVYSTWRSREADGALAFVVHARADNLLDARFESVRGFRASGRTVRVSLGLEW